MVNNKNRLSAVFGALADPTRRRILGALSEQRERPVAELAKPFRVSAPAISRHLRVLERAGMIHRRRYGREHLIRGRASALKEAQTWISHCVAGWEFSFDKLDELINEQRKDKKA